MIIIFYLCVHFKNNWYCTTILCRYLKYIRPIFYCTNADFRTDDKAGNGVTRRLEMIFFCREISLRMSERFFSTHFLRWKYTRINNKILLFKYKLSYICIVLEFLSLVFLWPRISFGVDLQWFWSIVQTCSLSSAEKKYKYPIISS